MLDPAAKAEFDKQFRIIQMIYFAMLASVGGCLVVGLLLDSLGAPAPGNIPSPALIQVLYVISAGLILTAFFIRKKLVRPLAHGSTTSEIQEWMTAFRAGHLASFVLCEAIGILGLLAVFLSGSKSDLIKLVVLASTALVLFRPKRIDSTNS